MQSHLNVFVYVMTICWWWYNDDKCNKAIVDIILRAHCALPSPPSWPIAWAQTSQESYLRLPGIVNYSFCCMALLAIELSLLQRIWQRHYFTFNIFPRKIVPSPWGIGSSISHMEPIAYPSHHAKWYLCRFSHFCMGPKCYAVQCIVSG